MPSAQGFPAIRCAQIVYDDDTGFSTDIPTAGTPVVLANAGFAAGDGYDPDGLFTVAATSGTITPNFTGTIEVAVSLSGTTDQANNAHKVVVFDGGTATALVARATSGATARLENVGVAGIINCTRGQAIDVRVDSDTNGDDFTTNDLVFSVFELQVD